MDEKSLLGSYSASTAIQPEVAELIFAGYHRGFDLTQLISHRLPLEEAVRGIEIASHPKGDSMKIMIEPVPGEGARTGRIALANETE
jgi:L-iditol 2-dehydrogenase